MIDPGANRTGVPPLLAGEAAQAREREHAVERLASGERGTWPRASTALRAAGLVIGAVILVGWVLTALAH